MNKILNDIIDSSQGHYCHVLEVSDLFSLHSIIDNIIDSFENKYSEDEIIEFFECIELIHLEDDHLSIEENMTNEQKVYTFDFDQYIRGSIS